MLAARSLPYETDNILGFYAAFRLLFACFTHSDSFHRTQKTMSPNDGPGEKIYVSMKQTNRDHFKSAPILFALCSLSIHPTTHSFIRSNSQNASIFPLSFHSSRWMFVIAFFSLFLTKWSTTRWLADSVQIKWNHKFYFIIIHEKLPLQILYELRIQWFG